MYKLFLFVLWLIAWFAWNGVSALDVDSAKMCTMEYAPVCWEKQITCFTTPCDPILMTYSNRCVLESAWAKFLYEGECKTTQIACSLPEGKKYGQYEVLLDQLLKKFYTKLDTKFGSATKMKVTTINTVISAIEDKKSKIHNEMAIVILDNLVCNLNWKVDELEATTLNLDNLLDF